LWFSSYNYGFFDEKVETRSAEAKSRSRKILIATSFAASAKNNEFAYAFVAGTNQIAN